MHDPMSVAFDVPFPFPRVYKKSNPNLGEPRWGIRRFRYANVTDPSGFENKPIYPWYRPTGWHLYAFGKRWRCVRLATVWHVEPGGADSGAVCSRWDKSTEPWEVDRSWRWHVRHWKIQLPVLQEARRRLFQRCAWCGGRSTGRNRVNCTYRWDKEDIRWWQSQPGMFHHDCMSAEHAYRSCACRYPMTRGGFGDCARCGNFRGWGTTPAHADVYRYIKQTVPEHTRPTPLVMSEVQRRWAKIREAENENA